MRWFKMSHDPDYGTIRARSKFLWLPLTIGSESRWLERATWMEKWSLGAWFGDHWRPYEWVDK